jgi:ATP-dependent DNA helicase RecG
MKKNAALLRETQTVELKESWQDEYLKTICAFSNTDGGVFYVGVDDNGNAVKLERIKYLLESLPNKILSTLLLTTSVEPEQYQGKEIIKITVPKKPLHSYNGVFYHRVGSTTQELKGAELQRLLLIINNLCWDETAMSSATIDDIDSETVERFVDLAIAKGRLPEKVDSKNIEKLFRNLNLINCDGLLTRAAVLLFGKEPNRFFISATIKMGRFRGSDSTDVIIHDLIKGNAFKMFEQAMDLLKGKYLWAPVSYDGMVRVETLEIPEKALREVILNAVVHRDYTSHSSISVRIFESRISVWNSGKLNAIKVEDLKKEHDSHKRNPLIADIFFRAGYIESWGRGTNIIVEECVNNGLDEPAFKEREGGLEVAIKRNPLRLADKGVEAPAMTINLSPRQQKILDCVRKNGSITNSICQELTNVSRQTATRELQILVEAKVLEQTGTNKGTIYTLMTHI